MAFCVDNRLSWHACGFFEKINKYLIMGGRILYMKIANKIGGFSYSGQDTVLDWIAKNYYVLF